MATSKTIATRRDLSDSEIAALTPRHELWGSYQRPPLEGHASVESFLDDIGIPHEDFANWLLNDLIAAPCITPTEELMKLARLFVRHRHEGGAALRAAVESMRSIQRIQAGARG